MKTLILTLIFLISQLVQAAAVSPILLLKQIEKKYQTAGGIELSVVKKLKIQLLEKEKKSEGTIKISGGQFKWEVSKPDHTLTLLTPDAVWFVEYPIDDQDRVTVLKSRKPKKSQSPAVVAFLMGQGSLTKSFRVTAGKTDGDIQELLLKAKSKDEMVQEMSVWLDKKEKLISKLSFKDAMGNQTDLEFKNSNFDKSFDASEFKFIPPKDADVNVVD